MTKTSLRDQQREFTRELIFQAVVDVVLEEGVHSFTIQRVAERAGISHRTVYRYFETKEALLEEMSTWSAEQMEERGLNARKIESIEGAPDHVRKLFALFDQDERWVRATIILRLVSDHRSTERAERLQATQKLLQAWAPFASEEERDRVAYVIHSLGGTIGWMQMREDWGIDGPTAAEAVAHTIDLLLANLKRINQRAARAQAEAEGSASEDRG